MAKYFNYFPTTFYSNANNTTALDTVTNIIARFSFENEIKNNSTIFYPYEIQDGDTPEIVASKYYGSPERHWVVLMFNDIIDPQYDWPLDQRTLITYINSKYSANGAANTTPQSGIVWAQNDNNVHSYYKVITRVGSGVNKNTIIEKIQVDANTYANVIVSTTTYTLDNNKTITETVSKEKLTYYDYEVAQNEAKRKIKLLRADYVTEGGLINELKRVLNQ